MRRHVQLAALVWAPFVSLFAFAAPALSARIGDSYPHMAFHLLAPAVLLLALFRTRALLSGAATRGQRLLLRVLTLSLPLAVLGNVVELVAAVRRFAQDGGTSRPTPEVFEGPGLHAAAANVTIPALMLSMMTVLVLLALVARHRRTRGRWRGGSGRVRRAGRTA